MKRKRRPIPAGQTEKACRTRPARMVDLGGAVGLPRFARYDAKGGLPGALCLSEALQARGAAILTRLLYGAAHAVKCCSNVPQLRWAASHGRAEELFFRYGL
ncbi:MAG: hypothetical protein ABSF90_14715 [Syntrophobacteraceae bacterium]|jgi:hypothetical protein